MKVVILGTRGFPNVQGGVEKHCECLSIHLVSIGCEVTVLTRKPYVEKDLDEFKGVKLKSLPTLRKKSLEAFLHTMIGVFVAVWLKPDILHIQAIGPALFTPLAKLLGIKVIVTSHGSNYSHLKWGRFAKLILRLGEFLGVRFADEVIAVSPRIAHEIKTKYNRDAIEIPNGVVIKEYTQGPIQIAKYGLTKGKYVLAVGRFVPEKGFDVLASAFRTLGLQDWKLVIVGNADHEDKYSLDLKEKLTKNVNTVMTGFLTEEPLSELYTNAGLFVIPSYYEGLPISLLEAMCHGLSCIASDIQGNRALELGEDRYFRAGDPAALAEKIFKYANMTLSSEEKQKQRDLINEKYNWERIAHRTLQVYTETITGHGTRNAFAAIKNSSM